MSKQRERKKRDELLNIANLSQERPETKLLWSKLIIAALELQTKRIDLLLKELSSQSVDELGKQELIFLEKSFRDISGELLGLLKKIYRIELGPNGGVLNEDLLCCYARQLLL